MPTKFFLIMKTNLAAHCILTDLCSLQLKQRKHSERWLSGIYYKFIKVLHQLNVLKKLHVW